jgi:uncharacterized membrane protein YedE/YeeE
MMLPFESLVAEHREFGLIVAVLIGFFFGFALERAGFGRATKLAGQFYLHDMTVFKVMFSAIVTAMLGVVILSSIGVVDLRALSESAASTTYIWPMLAGGLLLGVGFIVSGYCPGTSAVAIASGNLDGLFAFTGVIAGSIIYSEAFPFVESFHNSGNLGHLFLYDLFGLSPEVVATMVVAMAIGCFFLVDKVERMFIEKRTGQVPETGSRMPRRFAVAVYSTAALLALIAMSLPASQSKAEPKRAASITSERLARRTLDEPWTMRIIDIRAREACAKARVPGSECVPKKDLSKLGLKYSPSRQDVVLVDARQTKEIPAAVSEYPGKVLVLQGGFDAWKKFALSKPEPLASTATSEQRDAYQFRAAYHQMLTGVKQAPPPPKPTTTYVPKPKKKGGGCS